MKANRRKFLSLLGVGVAGAPIAAKAALDESILKQVGVTTQSFTGGAPSMSGSVSPSIGGGPATGLTYSQTVSRASTWIKMMGMPKDLEKEFRERARYVHALDPDIAAKRSWSMSVKLMAQRERNYERQVEALHATASYYGVREKMEKLLGFQWPF